MARQAGLIKVKGTLEGISFYQTKEGYLIRRRTGISAERMATDPAFARTREGQAEFGRAARGGRVIRRAFRQLVYPAADSWVQSRLLQRVLAVVKSDQTNERGERTVRSGHLELLEGFEFNKEARLEQALKVPYTTTMDRAGGELSIAIPPLVPTRDISAAAGATHYQLKGGGGAIDFEAETYEAGDQSSGILPIDGRRSEEVRLNFSVAPDNPNHLFLLLGICFYQEMNGDYLPLKNGKHHALAIIAARKRES